MRARSSGLLAALAERRPVDETVALVVAHPDDETLAAGGSLHLLRRLLLVHVTDGAPRRLGDAAREGFASPSAYAAARARELDAALALSGAAPVRLALGIPDQDATEEIEAVASRLREAFHAHDVRHVLTHAYEGGHPDHDAVARAVHLAADTVVEFAGYHAAPEGGIRTGAFLTPGLNDQDSSLRAAFGGVAIQGRQEAAGGSGLPRRCAPRSDDGDRSWSLRLGITPFGDIPVAIDLPAPDRARKRAMLDCFRTQQAILARFDPAIERFRPAPAYDFAAPPHPGRLLYEEWGWMTGASWRERAASAQ